MKRQRYLASFIDSHQTEHAVASAVFDDDNPMEEKYVRDELWEIANKNGLTYKELVRFKKVDAPFG